jgi:hypothetical protein
LGFRNPFGLKIVGDRLFVADNGRGLDRFVQIEAGQDYLWNGEDFSIATKADVTFFPSIGPAQVEYISGGNGLFPAEYENAFYIAASSKNAGLVRVPYDFDANVVSGVPEFFLRYIGPITGLYSGIVTGVALGPDGLYFVPLLPNGAASGTVFKITHDPAVQHPYRPEDISDPSTLLVTQGCLACHSLNGEGGTLAPALDREPLVARLQERLNSPEYLALLDEVDQLEEEPFPAYADAREQVRASEGLEKIRVWIYYRIVEPKFDNPDAQMPKLELTEDQAVAITDYLLSEEIEPAEDTGEEAQPESPSGEEPAQTPPNPIPESWLARLPGLRYRHLPFIFLAGALVGALAVWFYKR